jgi:hypothetical protein
VSAYRSPGRLTPDAQRLDLLQARADRRRGASALQTPGISDSGWYWTDLKAPASLVLSACPVRGRAGKEFSKSPPYKSEACTGRWPHKR